MRQADFNADTPTIRREFFLAAIEIADAAERDVRRTLLR
jgi:hypothetical protein